MTVKSTSKYWHSGHTHVNSAVGELDGNWRKKPQIWFGSPEEDDAYIEQGHSERETSSIIESKSSRDAPISLDNQYYYYNQRMVCLWKV